MTTTTKTVGAPVAPPPPEPPDGVTRVVMLARISGTRNGADWPQVGGEITLPATEAGDLIRNFLAKPAPESEEAEVIEPPEEQATVETPTESAVADQPPERAVISRAQSARPARGGRSKGNVKHG